MTLKRLCTAIVLPVLMLFIVQASFAQDKTVTGKVTDSKDGTPIAGVSVTAKGSNTGTQTAADGTYKINVPANATSLIFSAVGFGRAEVPISGTAADAILVSTSTNLNEVVVVGYGTARRKDLTGAVATVKEKDFNRGVITAPDQLIQGKAAGVLVINNTGQPGGSTTIRIRGSSSIRSSNQPLFVVDGVPLSGGSARPGATGGGDYSSDGGNPLNFINPNDIASMEILKDASATAVYGSRGANGVVLVTTKRGQMGVPYVDVNASVGFSNVLKKLEVLDAGQFRKALTDYGIQNQDFGGNVDAWDEITRTALTQNYNAAFGGGNENARYRFSAGYLDQQGVIENSEFKKYNAAFNSSFKFLPSKRLGLDFNVIVSQTNEELPPVSNFVGFTGNLISQALQWNPTLALRKADGSVADLHGTTTINPLSTLQYYEDHAKVSTILVSVAPSFKITKDLEYKFLYSVNAQSGVRKSMVNRELNLQGIENIGVAGISNNEQTNQQLTHTLSYNKQITSKFNLNAVVGYEWLIFDYRGNSQSGRNFTNVGLKYYDVMGASSPADRGIGSYASPNTELQSYFARGILNWDDRLILTATFRSDGSTKFGENNKYGYFPSFGLAWNLANENFLKGNGLFNNLKLRLGWGNTGNQEFPSGASLDRFSIGYNSATRQNWANPDLKWETSTTTNIGVDFALLDNRITGSVDWFNKETKDVLFEQTLVSPAPPGKIWVNLDGQVINKGFEITLLWNTIRSQNFNWNIGGNVSLLTNEVQGLRGFYETGDLRGQGFSDVRGQRVVAGQPINVWYLLQYEGIDKGTGQSVYGNDGQKAYSNSPNPKTLLGISTDATWGKFTASANFNGTFGHYLFNNTAATVLSIGNLNGGRNVAQSLFGGDAKEAVSNSAAPSTRYLEKGNYVKLANATLSYRVGNIGKSIRNLNISLTGQNLFIITNYTGFDPEVNTDAGFGGIPSLGVEYIPYPSARTVLLGVNFSL